MAESVSRAWLASLKKPKVAVLVVAEVVCKLPAICGVLGGLLLERFTIRSLSDKHAVNKKCSEKGSNKICDTLKQSMLAVADRPIRIGFVAVVWPVFVVSLFPVRRL